MVSIATTFYIWWTEFNLENTSCRKGRKLRNSRTKQIGCLDFRQNRKRLQAGFGSLRNLPVQTLTPFHNTNLHTELQISFDQPNRKWIICAWIIKRHNQGKVLQNVHTYTRRVWKHSAHGSLTTGKENSFWKIICAGSADTYWGMEKVMARDGRGARLYSQ